MKYKSTLLAQASGSVDGLVFSHNAGGPYIRRRATPTKWEQGPQADARNRMIDVSGMWNALSDAQRLAWATYAANTPWKNTLGATIYLSGRAHFIRSMTTRRWGELAAYDALDGPTTYGLPATGTLSVSISAATQKATVKHSAGAGWSIKTGGALIGEFSSGFATVKNVFSGPYKYTGRVLGNTATPPTSPWEPAVPYPVVVGQRVFYRLLTTEADGRVSAEVLGFCDVGV